MGLLWRLCRIADSCEPPTSLALGAAPLCSRVFGQRLSAPADSSCDLKLVICVAGCARECRSRVADDLWNSGPLFDEFKLTLDVGERTEVLGPLFNTERREESSSGPCHRFAPPDQPGVDAADFDFLYPLVTYNRFGNEYRFHILQVFAFAGGQDQEDRMARRFTLFPLYFQQRSADPERNYTALLPFYGDLRSRLFRDEIHFVLWPGYVRTRKKDVVTENYLLPFVHVRRGEGLAGWQFWPFYGRNTRT